MLDYNEHVYGSREWWQSNAEYWCGIAQQTWEENKALRLSLKVMERRIEEYMGDYE